MKQRASVLVVAAALATIAWAEEPKNPFPLVTGTKWTYAETRTGEGREATTQDVTFEVAERKRIKDYDCMVVKATYADGRKIELAYSEDPKGIHVVAKSVIVEGKTSEVPIPRPELFLKLPVKISHRWRYAHFDAAWMREEEVEVPAGKFKAFRAEYHRAEDDENGRAMCNLIGTAEDIVIWFAPGTGIVKERFSLLLPIEHAEGPPTFERVLKKIAK